jgi:hypothetical protein
MASGTLGKDLQNEKGPVIHRDPQMPLEVALLGRTERLVEQDLGGAGLSRQGFDLVGLATANEQGGVWRPTLAANPGDWLKPSSLGEQAELLESSIEMGGA